MIVVNTSARVILCGPYKLIPYLPVTTKETKRELVKKYPRVGALFDAGIFQTVRAGEAEKTEADTKAQINTAVADAKSKAEKSDTD